MDVTGITSRHISNFITRNTELDIKENFSEKVNLHTPMGHFRGHQAVRNFFATLDEYLPKGQIVIQSLKSSKDQVDYIWKAFCQTAFVEQGRCRLRMKKDKIVFFEVDCKIQPDTSNMG